MANKKIWIMIAALFAVLLGPAPAFAGFAIDNAVVLDPYDPVPPIQFSHYWYSGFRCSYDCGRCWHSCYSGCSYNCYRRCYDRCGGCDGCRRYDDCYDDRCGNFPQPRADLPCTSGDCYESTRWEHRFRDGYRVQDQWLDSGRTMGDEDKSFRHHFSRNDFDDE